MMKKIYLAILMALSSSTIASADSVDEAAKCAATFRILTTIGMRDEALGDHFVNYGLMATDMMGLYAREDRQASMTNGETSELVARYQLHLDEQQANGNAFIPYVASCTGWLVYLAESLREARGDGRSIENILADAPRPSGEFTYPFDDWPFMQELFYAAHSDWVNNGRLTGLDLRRLMGAD